jgi:hypothetical protein
VSWSRRFDDPIVLDDGTELPTLRHAIEYLARRNIMLRLRSGGSVTELSVTGGYREGR